MTNCKRAPRAATLACLGSLAIAGPASAGAQESAFDLPEFERLTFSIEYGFVKAGMATMEITTPPGQQHDIVVFTSRARSSSFFSTFYPVDDIVRSVVERETLLPMSFEKRLSEGTYTDHEAIVFDRASGRAIYAAGDTIAMPPQARDVLSAFYDVRRTDLQPGGSVSFSNHSGKKTVPIVVRVLGRETLETRLGTFRCIKTQPVLAGGGLFKNQGRVWVWFTDDERRIPVRMETKLAFGSIAAKIERIDRPDLRLDKHSQRWRR